MVRRVVGVAVLCGVVVWAGWSNRGRPVEQPAPVTFVAEGASVEMVARLDDGTCVYRVSSPRTVVPVVVVVGPRGDVAIR